MRLNEATALVNDRVVLRPYRRWHVPRYNEWMQSEELREATASEPLSLEEEYEMQQSWRLDDDKLTFIVHLRDPTSPPPSADRVAFLAAHNDSSTMIGDVNLFLHDASPPPSPSSPPSSSAPPPPPTPTRRAELEIMFPPTSLFPPRSGLALLTLRTFLSYASVALRLPPSAFFARIGFDNAPSLGLFRKLGFEEGKRVEVFREVEMRWAGREGEGEGWPWEGEEGWKYEEVEDPRDEERD
ncbi:hypothetical protein JCM6882_007000 [Rhodosporidiobolus microsporus]